MRGTTGGRGSNPLACGRGFYKVSVSLDHIG